MVPPGHVLYYFSINGEALNSDGFPIKPSVGKKLSVLSIPHTNFVQNIIKSYMHVSAKILVQMPVLPRAPPIMLRGSERIQTPWGFY